MMNLKSIFALPKWAKVILLVLSIIAVVGLIGTIALNQSVKGETYSANLTLNSQKSLETSSQIAYNFFIDFPKFKPLLRSKSISRVDIAQFVWDKRIDKNAIENLRNGGRNVWFESTQDLQSLGTESLGKVEYTIDFSPLLWNIVRYYIFLTILVFLFASKILYFIATTDNKKAQILLATTAFIAMSASFYNNAFGIEDNWHFQSWQRDTESHIIARSLADIYGLETQGYGLGFLKAGDIQTYGEGSDKILAEGIVPQSYAPYKSAIGIQGYMWSFVYRYFNDVKLKSTQTHLKDLKPLYVICSALNAISILIVAFLLGKIFGRLFGVVFVVSMFLSPWITNYGNNLYHNFYMWLMPSAFSFSIFLLLYKNGNHKKPKIALLSIGYVLSLFFKSLMSYEYLTSIVLFSLSPFFLAPFLAKMKFIDTCPPLKKLAKQTAMLFALAVLGFCFAFSIHTYMRGNGDFVAGVESIYKGDFLRRMVGGDTKDFDPVYAESLNANALQIIAKYLDWHSPIIVGFDFRGNFYVLLIINILLLIFAFKGAQRRLFVAMFVVFALPAISWFVFGKAHSYIHTHMNFVLWYFGFIAVLLYIPIVATLQSKRSVKKQ